MKSPAVRLAWYQYFLLDVIAFFSLVIAFLIFLVWKLIICCCCARKQKTE